MTACCLARVPGGTRRGAYAACGWGAVRAGSSTSLTWCLVRGTLSRAARGAGRSAVLSGRPIARMTMGVRVSPGPSPARTAALSKLPIWRGIGRVSACPCRYPAAGPRWSGVPHLPAGHGQHGQGRWPAIDLPAGCSAKSAQRPVRGLAPAFRGTGNIAATGREAAAPPGESAGANRDRVADGCSGDVSCAARSSGRGP